MPIDELERTLDRLASEGRRPKFIYTIPNFQNPAGVTMSLARRRRLVEVARERELLVLEDNPYGLLRYEGEPLPTLYSLDAESLGRRGGHRPRHLPGHVLEDPLAGAAARLGGRAAAGAREAQPRQTGRRPVLLAGHADVRGGLLRRAGPGRAARVAEYLERCGPSTAAARRDARVAAGALRRQRPLDQPPRGPVHLGDARRAHRHDRPAGAGPQERRGRVRARARRLHGRAQRAPPRCG